MFWGLLWVLGVERRQCPDERRCASDAVQVGCSPTERDQVRTTGYDISVASEIMAVLALTTSLRVRHPGPLPAYRPGRRLFERESKLVGGRGWLIGARLAGGRTCATGWAPWWWPTARRATR